MKKTVAFILVLCVCVGLCACAGETTQNPTEAQNTNATVATNDGTIPSQTEGDKDNNKTEKNEISFTELVAVDNAECLIKITGIEADNLWGYTLKAQLENKSTDKTYMFTVQNAAINGVQSDPLFATEVAAGKKANEEISFTTESLEENGISDFTDIELTFRVYDSNDWMADNVANETVHVYPYGEDKAVRFAREAQATDTVLVDNEYVTVIVTGYEDDDIWGYTANLFLVNKSDKNVMFSVEDASVNGFMADPFYATSVSAGKCAFSSMSWSDTTLEENSITAVEEIEFTFRAYDGDNWAADDLANEAITLNP